LTISDWLPDFIRARPHTFRMRLLQVAGRVVSQSRRLALRLGAHAQFPRDLLCGYERSLALALG
jgi:hypothetical protein